MVHVFARHRTALKFHHRVGQMASLIGFYPGLWLQVAAAAEVNEKYYRS